MGRKFANTYVMSQGVDAVWAALPDTLEACGFDVKSADDSQRALQAKKHMRNVTNKMVSLDGISDHTNTRARAPMKATWGEKLHASVSGDGARCELWLESRLVFGLIDWGENRKNVETIHAELEARLAL